MLAYAILGAAAIYIVAGFVFALAFIVRGAGTIDPIAAHSGWAFRLFIIPGAAALWPFLAKRWWFS